MSVILLFVKRINYKINLQLWCMWSSAISMWGTACHMNRRTSSMSLFLVVATGSHTHLRPIRKKIQSEFINPNNLWTDLISLVVGFPVLLLPFGGQVLALRRSEVFHTWTYSHSQFHCFISTPDLLPWLLLADIWGCERDVPQLLSCCLGTYTSECHHPWCCYTCLFVSLMGGNRIFLLKVSSHIEYSFLCQCSVWLGNCSSTSSSGHWVERIF